MTEFLDLFGEWAQHADGTPVVVVIEPPTGSGGWGPGVGAPVTASGTIPVLYGNRLVRGADNTEQVASVTLYVEGSDAAASACLVGAQITIDARRPTSVIRVDTIDQGGLFDYLAVFCE